MARFDVRVAAAALEIDAQWLGMTITRFPIVGVTKGRRGVTRTLSLDAVVCVGLAHALVQDAGIAVEPALDLAHRLLRAPDGEIRFGASELRLEVDVTAVRTPARSRLAHAVERSVEPARGRPRTRTARASDR